MRIYETVLGDTWDLIAFKEYGKERYAKDLVEANPEHIYTVIFSAGIKIRVPEIKQKMEAVLPPWKRGATNAGS